MHCGHRLDREGNHASQMLMGGGKKGGFKEIQVCVVLEQVRGE